MYPIKYQKDGNWLAETMNLQIPTGEMLSIWSIFDQIWMTYLAKYQKVIISANFPENKKGVDNEIRNKNNANHLHHFLRLFSRIK